MLRKSLLLSIILLLLTGVYLGYVDYVRLRNHVTFAAWHIENVNRLI